MLAEVSYVQRNMDLKAAHAFPLLHVDALSLVVWRLCRKFLRCLTMCQLTGDSHSRKERCRPVISSGKIESRTSRSSICSSRPIFPLR